MRHLEMNFASRPFRNNTLLWTMCSLFAVGLIAFTVWNAERWWDYRAQLNVLQSDISTLGSRNTEYEGRRDRFKDALKTVDVKALKKQAAKANDVIAWKSFSWTKLFNILEERQPFDVRMVSIKPQFYAEQKARSRGASAKSKPKSEPSADSVRIRLEGIAKEPIDFHSLQRSLICGTHFDQIEPIREVRTQNGEILFELIVLYYPNGSLRESVCPDAITEDPATLWEWDLAEEQG